MGGDMIWVLRRFFRALRAPLRRPLEPLLWLAAALCAKDVWVSVRACSSVSVHVVARATVPPCEYTRPHRIAWEAHGAKHRIYRSRVHVPSSDEKQIAPCQFRFVLP